MKDTAVGAGPVMIRSIDASLIYYMAVEQNHNLKEKIENFIILEKEKENLRKVNKRLNEEKRKRRNELKKFIYQMDEGKNCELQGIYDRYYYQGTLNDSLMRRRLFELSGGNAVVHEKGCLFTDIIINISFNRDYIIEDGMTYTFDALKHTFVRDTSKYRKVLTKQELRGIFYEGGVYIQGKHYLEFQRSSSKARTGNCLFIQKEYYESMVSWQRLGLNLQKETDKIKNQRKPHYQKVDLTGIRAYESLTSSSIVGSVEIDPYSILLIDDVKGSYTMKCNVVKSLETTRVATNKNGDIKTKKDNQLKIVEENYQQITDLWDGQSLVDESLFTGVFENKGFMLLRSHFLKSAGFNTKLQKWFKSDEVCKYLQKNAQGDMCVQDRFGSLMPVDSVMMVTTKNSCKIFKEPFRSCILIDEIVKKRSVIKDSQEVYSEKEIKSMSVLEQEALIWKWYRWKLKETMGTTIGVCKYEKSSRFQDGAYQQLAYQIISSGNYSYDDLIELARPQIQEINLIKSHVAFMRHILMAPSKHSIKQIMMRELLNVNDDIQQTQMYKDFRDYQISMMKQRIEKGKILTENTDYCVMFGNPYEMLCASTGMLDVNSDGVAQKCIMYNKRHEEQHQFECYTPKFHNKNTELFAFRNPHICEGNSALFINVYHPEYSWFNMTENIIAVSFWGYGAFLNPKLNGADVDSDTVLVGDNEIILSKVKDAQKKLIPINDIPQKAKLLELTENNLAKTDSRLCNGYIGKICNLAQQLQGFYWHIYNNKAKENEDYLTQIYNDICILEVLSNVAIDSAKREYAVDLKRELSRIKRREYWTKEGAILEHDVVKFECRMPKRTITEHNRNEYEALKVQLSNDCLSEKEKSDIKKDMQKIITSNVLIARKPEFMRMNQKYRKKRATEHNCKKSKKGQKDEIDAKTFISMEIPMDKLKKVVKDSVCRARPVATIPIVEVLNTIESGKKADSRRVNQIIEQSLMFKHELDEIQNAYQKSYISAEELYEKKMRVEEKAIGLYKNQRISRYDIITLIKKAYDVRNNKVKNGKLDKGNVVDRRDSRLVRSRCGGLMLQWIYAAKPEIFLEAIKMGGNGDRTAVKEVKRVELLSGQDEIFELYGKQYIII